MRTNSGVFFIGNTKSSQMCRQVEEGLSGSGRAKDKVLWLGRVFSSKTERVWRCLHSNLPTCMLRNREDATFCCGYFTMVYFLVETNFDIPFLKFSAVFYKFYNFLKCQNSWALQCRSAVSAAQEAGAGASRTIDWVQGQPGQLSGIPCQNERPEGGWGSSLVVKCLPRLSQ